MPANFPHTIKRMMSPQARAMRSGKHTTQLAGHLGDDTTTTTTPATDPNAINWGGITTGLITAGGTVASTILTDKYGNPVAAPAAAAPAAASSSMLPIVLGLGVVGGVIYFMMKPKHAAG